MYLEGRGVKFNLSKAAELFLAAARQGNAIAQFNIGNVYRRGDGVDQSDRKAVFWYQKAAKQNYAPAQNALAYMYVEGRSVERDNKRAMELFKAALEGGLPIAGQNLEILKRNGIGYKLATAKIDNSVRAAVLTETPLDLARWLEMNRVPKLGI
jgi:TPR repeat protein